jgi:hypothetical protein
VKSLHRICRQRGAALMALVALLTLGTLAAVVSRLDASSTDSSAAKRARNAQALNRAKQALIGYVVAQAVKSDEMDPGALPCPEPAASFSSTSGTDGRAAGSCTLPKVGRFPWRTVGVDQLVDAHGEPLWYVVSRGWAFTSANARPVINSDSEGRLGVDGRANAAVALIIAPGPPISVAAAPGCAAWRQVRPARGPVDVRNYLECQNALEPSDSMFVTAGPPASFNDQAVLVTVADLMPALEAAIAKRIEADIAPLIRTAYSISAWGGTPLLPFATPFANPVASSYRGDAGTLEGHLPATYATAGPCVLAPGASTCTPAPCSSVSDPRCDPLFVAWRDLPAPLVSRTAGAALAGQACSLTASRVDCTLSIYSAKGGLSGTMSFNFSATARNVAMALRRFNSAVDMAGIAAAPRSLSGTLGADGAARITLQAAVPPGEGSAAPPANCADALAFDPISHDCYTVRIGVPIALLDDHPVVQPKDPERGWFSRNGWHTLLYYAVASGHTPLALPASPSCSTGTTCVPGTNVPPLGGVRALLVLAGRRLGGAPRPSAQRVDYFEFGNAVSAFERQPVRYSGAAGASIKAPFNDRIVVVDAN